MPRPVTILLVVLLALAAVAVSRPAPVRAQTTFSNTMAITIPDSGAASLYPSPIAVSGLSGVITDLDVTLSGLSHTFPNDLDILLVGPTGQTALLWSDFGAGNDFTNATVTFDDAAPSPAIPLVSGSVRPSYDNGFDTFPAPAPGAPHGVLLAGFNGTDPNGTWSLFVNDDLAGDSGMISGGWSLTITTAPAVTGVATTLSNPAELTIPAGPAPANPYPSTIAVSGLLGTIVDVEVTLTGLSHTFASDLDILLVGPGGQHVMLMSDLDGANDFVNVTLTFDDMATAALLALPLASGTFQPTSLVGSGVVVDPLPAPAPGGPHGTNLSVFTGTAPNGTWSLFVSDDLAGDSGTLSGGWSLTITTFVPDVTPPVLTVPTDLTVEATSADGAMVTFSATATDDVDGPLTPTCAPPSGSTFQLGTTTVTCTATDAAGNMASASFTVTVQDTTAPVISVPADLTVSATSPSGATVTYSATATDAVDGALTPSCDPPSGSTFPLGATTVTCTVTDSADNMATATFTVTVVDATAPVITVPATISVLATSPAGAVVTYSVTATDDIDGPVPVTCTPPSGSTFPIGTTTVECTATDAAGNVGTASFQVIVGGPVLSQLSPNRLPLTSTAQTLTIRGHNFIAGATVTVGTKTYAATFVSSTELRVSVVPKDVFVYGWLVIPTATVRVTNPGGATSNSLTLYLTP
jgi:subtilisin-like proprotein convertase family protein